MARRWLLLWLLVAAIAGAGASAAALHRAEPWLDGAGYPLPAAADPPLPYLIETSAEAVALGDLWGVRVMPYYARQLRAVQAQIAGLPGVGTIPFYRLDDGFVALIPVSYSAKVGDHYQLELVVTDHRGRQHPESLLLVVADKRFPEQRLWMTAQQTGLMTADRMAEDRAKINSARANPSPAPLWSGPLLIPLEGRLTSEFGLIRYVNNVPYGRHSGLDIAAPQGSPIVAAAAGRVTFTGSLWASGETVILDHGLGMFTAYNHMSRILAEEGQMVAAGEVVGEVGSTGFSTGPHLHFTLWVGSVPTNPWPWFEEDPITLLLGTPAGPEDAGSDGDDAGG